MQWFKVPSKIYFERGLYSIFTVNERNGTCCWLLLTEQWLI